MLLSCIYDIILLSFQLTMKVFISVNRITMFKEMAEEKNGK